MENWEENVVDRTSFGLVKLAEAAIAVPFWEYGVLAFALIFVWFYRKLEFHFFEECLRGFRGEVPFLHYNSASKVAEYILPKCKNLKRRFCATPWLSSPHLQIAFLHFKGNPPQIEYHRELYVTHDEGTIALDWVKLLLGDDENSIATDRKLTELDESPIVFIIPGLVSESNDPVRVGPVCEAYCVQLRYEGLEDFGCKSSWTWWCIYYYQFYNAGWTEDLRTIINHIHSKYPQAPLFTIGTSMGANILVKYLGEEGASTPVGAAAVVNCPWDLLICNRFLSRKGIQKIYNRVLAFGLVQYLSLHHVAIGQIAEWTDVIKSKSLYDVDHHFTRHTGKYETVDTYYRRTCSADYLTKVAVPLLCFSALDDPICTKEAIPWDEARANPNVIMVVTRHGSHLAYFEGLTAQSIWWVRAVTDYMTAIISSNLMHTQQNLASSTILKNYEESNIAPAHVWSASSSSQIAAEDSRLLTLASSSASSEGEESENARSRATRKTVETSDDKFANEEMAVTLTFTKSLELTALQSALSQILLQLQASRPELTTEFKRENLSIIHSQNESDAHMTRAESTAMAEASVGQLKLSAVSTLQESSSHGQSFKVPISPSVVSALKRCRETATKLAFASKIHCQKSAVDRDLGSISSTSGRKFSDQANESQDDRIITLAAQNGRRTLWLLTYIALVATVCPLIGSAIFTRWRGKFMNPITKGRLLK